MDTVALFGIFIILFLIYTPIAVSLAIASIVILAATTDFSLYMIAQRMFNALDSTILMAIPGFVYAGTIMAEGGISKYLIDCIRAWCGHIRGGLSVVVILSCMLFAAISGSSPATAAAVGGIMIPALTKNGYDKKYAMGLVAAAGTLGIMIPPSISFVLIAVTSSQSIGKLFTAGILPGIFLGVSLIIMALIIARIKNYGGDAKATWGERWSTTVKAIPGILMPILILGTIYGGIATPTETSIIAVFYSLFVGKFIYKELTWEKFRSSLREGVGISSMIFLIIPAAMCFGLFLTSEQVPHKVLAAVSSGHLQVWQFWVITQLMFFVMGTFLEAVSIILITLPILMPIVTYLGINPIHFAVVMVVNMELAMITPPVGLNLFVVAGIGKSKLGDCIRGVFPFLVIMIVDLILLVLFPIISTYLPGLMK